MNPSLPQILAGGFTFSGTMIGVPSLSVLLLHAINEIRGPLHLAPAGIDLDASPDVILALLHSLTVFSQNHAGLALLGFLLACGCWLLSKELKVSQTQSRQLASAVPHPCLSVSIRG